MLTLRAVTDLEATKNGLDRAGPLPNFSGLREVEAEPEVEPEPEPETESEEQRLERCLQESRFLLTSFITYARGYGTRLRFQRIRSRVRHANAVQAQALGCLARRRHAALDQRHVEHEVLPRIQAAARRRLAVDRHYQHLQSVRRLDFSGTAGRIQAACRAKMVRQRVQSATKQISNNEPVITAFQALVRGKLSRDRFNAPLQALDVHQKSITRLQARIRGVLIRVRQSSAHDELVDSVSDITAFQAIARGALSRRRAADTLTALSNAAPAISRLQATLRGKTVRRRNEAIKSYLQQAHVASWASSLQKMTRAAVVRKQHDTERKQLEFVQPDVTRFQAMARGAIERRRWLPWRDYLRMPEAETAATALQSITLGLLARRRYFDRMSHYWRNEWAITRCQAVVRQRQQRRLYVQLMSGRNVPIEAIANFLDLLRDSAFDFKEELELDELQHQVIERIRRNHEREAQAISLEYKVELLVKGKITLDEVERAKRAGGTLTGAGKQQANNVLMAARDPFALGSLDSATRRKLECYQELFYMLQTQPEYLARVLHRLSRADPADRSRTNVERIVLTIFGYAQQSREEYLMLKLFQVGSRHLL